MIEVKTQAQLEKALESQDARDGRELIVVIGDGHLIVSEGAPWFQARESSSPTMEARGSSSPTMVARGSSSPTMVAWGSSSPTMEAWESSSPRMVAWESSSPRMVARESSSPTMVAWESSSPTMVAWGSSSPRMEAWESSSVTGEIGRFAQPRLWRHDEATIDIPGAVILEAPRIETAADWCELYGVEVRKGGNLSRALAGQDVAILFKALNEGFQSSRGFTYEPGSAPSAPDWDGGKRECGGGLHFSPHPKMALEFNRQPEHFVACPVLVSEIVVHLDGTYPSKVKAPRCCAPVWEVDRHGERIEAGS